MQSATKARRWPSLSTSLVIAGGIVLSLLAATALVAATAKPVRDSPPLPVRAGDRIVAVSLGATGAPGYLRTIRRLARRRFAGRLEVVDAGTFVPDTARQELPPTLATLDPTWLLLSVGPAPGAAAEDTAALRELLRAVRARTRAGVVLLPPPILDENTRSAENDRRMRFARALRALALAEGAQVADVDYLLSLSMRAAQLRGRSFHLTADNGARLHEAAEFLIAAAVLRELGIPLPEIIDQAQPDDPTVRADDARIQYWGPWDRRDARAQGAITVNTGATIVAAFEGRGIIAHFDTGQYVYDAPTIWVRVDEEPWRWLALREELLLNAHALPAGRHQVRMVVKAFYQQGERWNPPLEADVIFRGFSLLRPESSRVASRASPASRFNVTLSGAKYLSSGFGTQAVNTQAPATQTETELEMEAEIESAPRSGSSRAAGGRLLAPPRRLRAVVETFGDSLVEGVEGARDALGDLEDGRASWAYESPLAAGAEPRMLGFAGLGVTTGGNGGVPPALYSFQAVHARDRAGDELRAPDVVVICLGSNDGSMPADGFVAALEIFLRAVGQQHPRARVLCLRPFSGIHGDDVRTAVADAARAGMPQLAYVDTTGWVDRRSQTNDGIHLNSAGNQAVAQRLTPLLKRALSGE
jgi:lysophospholipase L1-like esterase